MNYKRKIASRKLNRKCDCCDKTFLKGNIYYDNRQVFTDEDKVFGHTYRLCPKCKYKEEQLAERIKRCPHPKHLIKTEWDYIYGECVKEPQYDYCGVCGEIFD